MYRNNRQLKILELIETQAIDTQEELVARLLSLGYKVTQATVSRDIKSLGLIKITTEDSRQRYSKELFQNRISAKFSEIISNGILKIIEAGNAVAIKVEDGCGKLIKQSLKKLFADNLCCVADDDTVLIVFADSQKASMAVKRIREHF